MSPVRAAASPAKLKLFFYSYQIAFSLTDIATKASTVNTARSYFREHGTGDITATSCPGDVLTQTLLTFFYSQKA